MTLEQNLTSIAESLKIIATALSTKQSHTVAAPVAVQAPVVPNVVSTPAPAPIPVVPVMATPAPTVAAPAAPVTASHSSQAPSDFNLTTFVLDSYKKLGPVKGAGIQAVLQGVGAKNINDVKPDQYAAVKAGVEALLVA